MAIKGFCYNVHFLVCENISLFFGSAGIKVTNMNYQYISWVRIRESFTWFMRMEERLLLHPAIQDLLPTHQALSYSTAM